MAMNLTTQTSQPRSSDQDARDFGILMYQPWECVYRMLCHMLGN